MHGVNTWQIADIYTIILRYVTSRKLNTVIIVTSYIHTDTGRRDIQVVPRNPIYWRAESKADTAVGVYSLLECGMHAMWCIAVRDAVWDCATGWSAFCRSVCLSIYLTLLRGWRQPTLKRLYPGGNPNPSSSVHGQDGHLAAWPVEDQLAMGRFITKFIGGVMAVRWQFNLRIDFNWHWHMAPSNGVHLSSHHAPIRTFTLQFIPQYHFLLNVKKTLLMTSMRLYTVEISI